MTDTQAVPKDAPIRATYLGSFSICCGGATFDFGKEHGRGGVLPRLCRHLVRNGEDPERAIRVTRNGVRVFAADHTIGYWAGLTVREDDGRSVGFATYREFSVVSRAA